MTVYALAQLTIVDPDRYRRYRENFLKTLQPFGGRLLAADEQPVVIEGDWRGDKIVLLQFADEETFRSWVESPAYASISGDRKAGATGPVLLVHGVAPLTL